MKKYTFFLLFILAPLFLCALDCSNCGRQIRGNYIKTDRAAYCSEQCFHSTLPTCAGCRKKCERQVFTLLGKKFCSRECMYRTIRCHTCGQGADNMVGIHSSEGKHILVCPRCHKRPQCYFCAMPCDRRQLHDGRRICATCRKTAVTDHDEIRRIFREVRRNMGIWFGFDQRHRIELVIVPVGELNRQARTIYLPQGGKRLSLMNYEREVTERRYVTGRTKRYISKERCRIFILDTIPRVLLYDTLAHELTHDYLRHNLGRIRELADEEGFCELTAAIYNQKTGNGRINKLKDTKQDPVYGGGYRKMKALYQSKGQSWLRTLRAIKADPKSI